MSVKLIFIHLQQTDLLQRRNDTTQVGQFKKIGISANNFSQGGHLLTKVGQNRYLH